ncbi:MAG: glycerate kinase [Marinifilaceae bacterium]|jgi:glycerate kinase|nr:glycerate kinase [Marinifilaceae bacterium]
MNILFASNSWKNSLDSKKINSILSDSFRKINKNWNLDTAEIADGGDGSLSILSTYLNTKKHKIESTDLSGNKRIYEIRINTDKKIAILETAQIIGLCSLKQHENLNPFMFNSFAIGDIIKMLSKEGISEFYLCIGGTATLDMGMGALSALGAELFDNKGQQLNLTKDSFTKIDSICVKNIDKRIQKIKINLLCDVENTICGKNGAAYVFGKQKGLKNTELSNMNDFHFKICKILSADANINLLNIKKGGAGGGIGLGLISVFTCKIYSGSDFIFEIQNIENKIKKADIIITGEGRIDSQTKEGKAPWKIGELAKKHKKLCIALCGSYENINYEVFSSVFSCINGCQTIDSAIKNSELNISETAKNIAALIEQIREN